MSRPEHPAPSATALPDVDPGADTDPGAAAHALLAEPLSLALRSAPCGGPVAAVRERLRARLAASLVAEAGLVTRRLASTPALALAPGVSARCLHALPAGRPPRAGEPLQAWLLDLAPGAVLPPDALAPDPARLAVARAAGRAAGHVTNGTQREWLLLAGELQGDGLVLGPLDYHARAPGLASPTWATPASGRHTRVFYREALLPGPGTVSPAPAITVRDAQAGWPAHGPGIRRRVLWQHGGQAALLYRVEAGASVPRHVHGHDEECLMVEGDVFLDDLLLRAGDYQLAPAGSGHGLTITDTGGVLYAHGDLDLQFIG